MTTSASDTHLLLAAFVDELVRCGMTDACTSPGSRCTPLVLALAREPRLQAHSHIDERCAGFFAVGLAKAAGRPVAVTCTSGTAAANLLPAVIEAHEARVPLIVLSADRPPELRDVGAGQTIDQIKLYGDAVRWFVEVGTHAASRERVSWMRALACRAYWTATGDRPGPVHLNWPLREPLLPDSPPPPPPPGRADGRPWVARTRAPAPARGSALELPGGARGVVVAGRCDRGLAPEIPAFAAGAGYPLLADPLSGARSGAAAIGHYDALLRVAEFNPRPELVIRVGDLPTSKPLRGWLARHGDVRQIAITQTGLWQDPDNVVRESAVADPRTALHPPAPAPADWLERWLAADARAAAALDAVLADELSEPVVARSLGRWLPADATLFVAASMPIRDVETFWPVRDDGPRLLSNRGANGIDGTISSAFGAVAARTGPVVALLGDVALAHDIGGLLAATRLGLALTIVLLNNGGGGIFDFLPVARETDAFERHIATPTGLEFAHAATLYGLGYTFVRDLRSFRAALDAALAGPGSTLIEVGTSRTENVALHGAAWAAVGRALAD